MMHEKKVVNFFEREKYTPRENPCYAYV